MVCNDENACTLNQCVDDVGCVFTPRCTPNGCVTEPKDCDDEDPCTIDVCLAGVCRHQPHTFCDDNRRCTRDICVPDAEDPTRFSCNSIVDTSLCGPVAHSCQRFVCTATEDCLRITDDSLCPDHPTADCFVGQCTNNGCGFRDICGLSTPTCNGCAQCTCNASRNPCIPSCPS